MYKAILKEIGAEESDMGYLFDESDDEDIRGDDHERDENSLGGDNHSGNMAMQQLNRQTLTNGIISIDDHLLRQWESEFEDNAVDDPNEIKRNTDDVKSFTRNLVRSKESICVSSDIHHRIQQQPAWEQMFEMANAKQEQLMGEMINLQMAQKESSPRNKIKRPTIDSEKTPNEGEEMSDSSPIVLQEINANGPNLNPSTDSSSTMQQISKRNAKLQDQWQSQQEKSVKLQDKLTIMQTQFYNQQDQWEKEQQELFSPTRSPSKIPRWRSSTLMTTNTVAEIPTVCAKMGNETDCISPKNTTMSLDNTSSKELEASTALVLQLEAQLQESRKAQQSQKDELGDCKDRLKKRDVEHQAFLLRYETEKKSWNYEMKEKQIKYHDELQSREADLEDTRQNLHQQIAANQSLREKHREGSKELTSKTIALKEELEVTQNQIKSEREQNQKQTAYIQELKDEKHQLKTGFTRKEGSERTQYKIESNTEDRMEEQIQKTSEFQSRIREIEGRHIKEVEYWKAEVEDYRRQIELNSMRMESHLMDANARYAELERKHDKEFKEWQLLLDANITKIIADEDGAEDQNILEDNKKNLMVIGAGNTSTELLSPIRKAPSMPPRQTIQEGAENNNISSDGDNSLNYDSESIPSESINMINDLLEELGEMDLERTAILKEISCDNHDGRFDIAQIRNKSEDAFTNANRSAIISEAIDGKSDPKTDEDLEENNYEAEFDIEESPQPLESSVNAWGDSERKKVNTSDATNDSEVLDETLHLLNNLKNMLSSHGMGNEHETTVLERLEVLSELMQSQDQSNAVSMAAKPDVSSGSAGDEMPFAISASQGNTNDTSWISTAKAIAPTDPWPILVTELKNRCDFLERDRDEVTRITEQILKMERASHKVELETAIATTERKANETLHRIQLESNQEMNGFYQKIYFQCQQESFDYSSG